MNFEEVKRDLMVIPDLMKDIVKRTAQNFAEVLRNDLEGRDIVVVETGLGVDVRIMPLKKKVGDLDKNTVIRFEFKGGGDIENILVGYGPWVIDFLPDFNRMGVEAYYMTVSPFEFEGIKERNMVAYQLMVNLAKDRGIELGKVDRNTIVVEDVVRNIFRREFGVPGELGGGQIRRALAVAFERG